MSYKQSYSQTVNSLETTTPFREGSKYLPAQKEANLESRCLSIHWNMTEWSSGLRFERSQACESHHDSSTWDPEAQAGSHSDQKFHPGSDELAHPWGKNRLCTYHLITTLSQGALPGYTTTTVWQYEKIDRQSKRWETNIGSYRSPNVITTPYSQLLTTMSLLVGNIAEELRSDTLQEK